MKEFVIIFSNGATLNIKAKGMGKVMDGAFLSHDEEGTVIAAFPIAAIKCFYAVSALSEVQ